MKSPKGCEEEGDSFFPIHPRAAVGDAAEGRGFFSLPGVRELAEPVLHSHLLLTPRAGQRRRKRLLSCTVPSSCCGSLGEASTQRAHTLLPRLPWANHLLLSSTPV